ALASYNIGYGHVKDALKIAAEKGYDTQTWQGLKATLPLLSKSRYYKKTQHGYARGWEPVHYVERILTYFDILKQKTLS
ncbi:MAG: lytic transglycosylase F, partial [Desulfobacterales bacterium]|nr:lytic transglycosylase F [Desulfobacterales bacterium]